MKDNVHILEEYGVYYEPGVNKIRYKKNRTIKFIPARLNKMIQGKTNEEKDIFFQLEEYKGRNFIINDKNFIIDDIVLNDENKVLITIKDIETEIERVTPLPLVEKSITFLEDLINGRLKKNDE